MKKFSLIVTGSITILSGCFGTTPEQKNQDFNDNGVCMYVNPYEYPNYQSSLPITNPQASPSCANLLNQIKFEYQPDDVRDFAGYNESGLPIIDLRPFAQKFTVNVKVTNTSNQSAYVGYYLSPYIVSSTTLNRKEKQISIPNDGGAAIATSPIHQGTGYFPDTTSFAGYNPIISESDIKMYAYLKPNESIILPVAMQNATNNFHEDLPELYDFNQSISLGIPYNNPNMPSLTSYMAVQKQTYLPALTGIFYKNFNGANLISYPSYAEGNTYYPPFLTYTTPSTHYDKFSPNTLYVRNMKSSGIIDTPDITTSIQQFNVAYDESGMPTITTTSTTWNGQRPNNLALPSVPVTFPSDAIANYYNATLPSGVQYVVPKTFTDNDRCYNNLGTQYLSVNRTYNDSTLQSEILEYNATAYRYDGVLLASMNGSNQVTQCEISTSLGLSKTAIHYTAYRDYTMVETYPTVTSHGLFTYNYNQAQYPATRQVLFYKYPPRELLP